MSEMITTETRKKEDFKGWEFLVNANSVSEERLDRVAVIAMDRTYTYRQMFRKWERYAEVFSALNITGENHSRLAIFDCSSVESSFAIYGANMTGASVSGFSPTYISDKFPLDLAIKGENITDLFINDLTVNKKLLLNVARKKLELGIRNIIVVRVPLESDKMDQRLIDLSKKNYKELKTVKGVLFMEELLDRYEATPIRYASTNSADDAFIMHTSGTTKGISKPVPLSDLGLNSAALNAYASGKFNDFEGGAVVLNTMVATSVYGLVNQLHEPFAFGCTVVIMPLSNVNPFFMDAIGYYKVNVLFITPFYFEMWAKCPPQAVPDFSSVKCVVVGGAYMSAEARERYKSLMKEHGGQDPQMINGYGMSETAGACILQTEEVDNDSIGYPLPGVRIKIYDENEQKYYSVEDRHPGVLYIHSDSISLGKIDDTVFFETEEIDGLPYICTYDLVHVNEDGSLSCRGRANRYFVNNDGVKFDAGIVETMIQAEPGIEAAAVVPWYDKMVTHDTVPVLYVQPVDTSDSKASLKVLKAALRDVFIDNEKEKETNLPMQCVIAAELPRNANGKIDIYRITQEDIPGQRYIVRTRRKEGTLKDIILEPVTDLEQGITNGEVPKELSKAWDGVRRTVEDETVTNLASGLLNERMMAAMANPQMIAAQQMQWFMQTITSIQNTVIKMWNDAVAALQAPQMPQMPQTPYTMPQMSEAQAPQMPQPPYMMPQMTYAMPQGSEAQAPQMPQPPYMMPQMTYAMPQGSEAQAPQMPYMMPIKK